MNTLDFKISFLGQAVLRYRTPAIVMNAINEIYEKNFVNLPKANKQLVGKIEKVHSLFFNGEDNNKMHKHNLLPSEVLIWFEHKFKHYLDFRKIKGYEMHFNSIWINEMKEHEYNPVHIHQGSLFTGLSSVMILKLPNSFGKEYSAEDTPMNGRLQILGSASGQFASIDYSPDIMIGDFYIFPYDMRHCVYPFNGPGMRRTLAANMDVNYDPIINRSIS